jgi:hypothetical protein
MISILITVVAVITVTVTISIRMNAALTIQKSGVGFPALDTSLIVYRACSADRDQGIS